MSLSHPKTEVGYLVPLNHNLEENPSAPKLPISHGTNLIGRANIPLPLPDKRLSRNHITLTASSDGSAHLLAEGTNPVVVNSRNKRRKLNSQENAAISDGDILELIPGHHLFKYEVSGATKTDNTPFSWHWHHKQGSFSQPFAGWERDLQSGARKKCSGTQAWSFSIR